MHGSPYPFGCMTKISNSQIFLCVKQETTNYKVTALTVGHCCCSKRVLAHEFTNTNRIRTFTLLCCQGRTPNPEEKKDDVGGGKLKLLKWKMLNDVEKRVKQNLSPQQKGDWKDLLLMSISFAVYVYISQMLVCAYFAWTAVPKAMW